MDEINKITPTIQFSFSILIFYHNTGNDIIQPVHLPNLLALQLDFSIAYPQQVFVYSDLIQSQHVGDTKAPLHSIGAMTDTNHVIVQTITLQNVDYFALSKLGFDTIEILLKTRQDEIFFWDIHGDTSLSVSHTKVEVHCGRGTAYFARPVYQREHGFGS